MRHLLLLAAVAALSLGPLAAAPAEAQIRATASDSLTRIIARLPLEGPGHVIVSRDGHNAIVHRGDAVVIQLTDAGLAAIGRGDRDRNREGEQRGFARLIETVARVSVRALLDNAIEYDLAGLSEVRYEEGSLVFLNLDGKRVFESLVIEGEEFMDSFAPRDAEVMARRLNREITRRR
jgi:hypothetical protein